MRQAIETTSISASRVATFRKFAALAAFGVFSLLNSTSCAHAQTIDLHSEMVPREVEDCLRRLPDELSLSTRLNPFYLRGDFDGDQVPDYAFLAVASEDRGVAVCLGKRHEPVLLGAGRSFHEMTDLDFDAWTVYSKGPVERGAEEEDPPQLRGDAVLLTWSESASALVFWDGQRFSWYQQGD